MPSHASESNVKRFYGYLKDFKIIFLLAIVGMVGYAGIDTFVFSRLEPIVDNSLANQNYSYLRMASYFIVPIFLLRGIFNFMGTYSLEWISAKVVMKMRQELFSKFIHLPVEYHDKESLGTLISKVTFDTEQVAKASGRALLTLVREGAFVIGLVVVMFLKSWQLSLVFILIGPIVAIIVAYVSKRFRKVSKNIQKAMGNLTSTTEQAIKGHKVVRMFGAQDIEQERFLEKNNHNRQQTMKLRVAQILSVSSIQVIASIALASVLYIASTPGMIEELTAGIFVNVVMCMIMLLKPLKQLTTVNTQFQRGMTACGSIFKVLDQLDESNLGTHTVNKVKGEIVMNSVSFTYPLAERPALQDISFTAKPGETIALVGRSGSGKSTISSLLTRFYSAQQGEITIDGVAIEQYELKNLRSQFALVSQQVTLFNDTIANNIAYGYKGECTREQIEQAAKVAHVLEFAETLENGLDTVVGEDGGKLSGGQRQRIAIARAVLLKAPILILDEATSALDTESEKLIQDALNTLQKSCTSIVVAHRLSTIENADKIIVIDDGKIIEQGNHCDLLENKGIYSQLHQMQFGDEANQ